MHLVGYSDNAMAYRFYNLSSKTNRNVKFHEEFQLQNIRERK
jgi:hypothetical protein